MLLFDSNRPIASPALAPSEPERDRRQIELAIGLVNNMPDGALKATERQFARLLGTAAPHVRIRFHCFSLPSIPRAPAAQTHIARTYADIAELRRLSLDGLIVTGAEPIAEDLRDEPYWPELTAIIDWAKTNTRSTIWSCLAAHAAVQHLDGIARRRLDAKCSGIYDCAKVADDQMTRNIRRPLKVSHSRFNTVDEQDLVSRGYQILTRSNDVGVDIFSRDLPSRFVFFQGHPEYDALSLQREYMRDIARYLSGERRDYPKIPVSYFDPQTEDVLRRFEVRARQRRDPTLAAELPGLRLRPDLAAGAAATLLFSNWVGGLARSAATSPA
ncbi:Homoserine O-succinyltransferase (Homoserine O-transsuccinylase) (HTS) [Bradyrhizobium sp. STM 3843]|uniref:homoserine O-succinyltransferase MetA n=1 Tax=Bradyrhizobium sp. STM 3843 TaxID=551947 RepID=UPI0002407C16|nr:homoserine O-succinyltransferase [Bradyrhizobium sp. STM 3843]CCE07475.1 Homoserine O-succinyltransferase (Homoserine O-transsuccinylase) (HTS) [Bradyrhizobium sp. STM 3843]